uniref:Uncharacterized protein n=1 Tax=viral metagenome TaxID=1070528 RepID=A0A6M3K2B3_9ZZZZ
MTQPRALTFWLLAVTINALIAWFIWRLDIAALRYVAMAAVLFVEALIAAMAMIRRQS